MVAIKRIRLEGLGEEDIAQLMKEVDLVKRLSHPGIVKYEGMSRDENTLDIVLECVSSSARSFPACALLTPPAAGTSRTARSVRHSRLSAGSMSGSWRAMSPRSSKV